MDLHTLGLGFVAGLLAGGLVATLIASVRHDRDRRHARRFLEIAEFARQQDQRMDDAANDGANAVPPDAQDWCDLYDLIQPYEVG